MKNQEIAKIFENIASILEIRSQPSDRFRIRAYQNASEVLRELPIDIESIVMRGELLNLPGIGKDLGAKIVEYVNTGHIHIYEQMLKSYPQSLLDLLNIQSLGPKKLKLLYETFGVVDLQSLEKILKSGEANNLPKFGEKTVKNILDGVNLAKITGDRALLGFIYPKVKDFVERLKKIYGVEKVEFAGSTRRMQETIGDIDLLVASKNPKEVTKEFLAFPEIEKVLVSGDTKTSVLIQGGRQVDLRIVDLESFGAALQYFTGSVKHNVAIRTLALKQGLTINEYGVYDLKTAELKASKTEEEVYKIFGLQYIPPEIRTDSGEIELAVKNQIPRLIDLKDIKGDLHCHSSYSDGRNSIEEMAVAAQNLGYEYIALTDHSPRLSIAHGVSIENLKKKKVEIKELNKKFPIKIFFGTEVDILEDGSIDYPDEILKDFDIVIASIHNKFNQNNTDRICRAMENKYVNCIGHPTGRLIGSRDSYPLDFDKVFDKAIETNTWLEINCQPARMDLPDIYIRAAKNKGVKFLIDTDSHFDGSLWLMEMGVGYARRGWVEKGDVMNTLSLKEFEKALKEKNDVF